MKIKDQKQDSCLQQLSTFKAGKKNKLCNKNFHITKLQRIPWSLFNTTVLTKDLCLEGKISKHFNVMHFVFESISMLVLYI